MQVFKIGDSVSVLNETIRGKIISIESNRSKIKDEDGFIREFSNSQLVLLKPAEKYKLGDDTVAPEILDKLRALKVKGQNVKTVKAPEIISEIDLHYEALTESLAIKSNHEILQKQLTACRSFVQRAIAKRQKRIVIIHGKGEGVLKTEIHLYLNRLSSERGVRLEFHDASYSEYGIGGATEVIFY